MAAHMEVWEKLFISLHCLNFGITEDKTQHVLWRIENGEIGDLNPKVVVLAVGANNYKETSQEIVEGIQACVQAILTQQPSANLVVLKLLPCGQNPNPLRDKFSEVNSQLETAFHGEPRIYFTSVDPGFVNTDGSISHHDMYDYAHLTRHAYTRAFEPLAEFLQELLGHQLDIDEAKISDTLEQLQ